MRVFPLNIHAMHPTLESVERDVAQWMENADPKWRKLLTKILHHPQQVTQSVLTHLGKDTAVWHNSLTFLSRKEPEGMAELMLLAAEVLREDKAGSLFGVRELTDIARMSMGTWLSGKHKDHVDLRKRTALVIGEMLDDPERRPRVLAALEGVEGVQIPSPMDFTQADLAQEKTRLQEAMKESIREISQEAHESQSEMAQALSTVLEGDLASQYLEDGDFSVAIRLMGEDGIENSVNEILSRLSARMMDRAVFDIWKPEAQVSAPKAPKP